MNELTHCNSSSSARKTHLSLAKRLFRRILATCKWLAVTVLMLLAGLLLMMTCFFIRLLWFYIGIAAVSVIFPSVFIAVRRRHAQNLAALLAAARWSVIAAGLIGLLLWPSLLIVPGYKTSLAGYWLHVKIWLNPAQVRQWAAAQQPAADRTEDMPYPHWPSSLQHAASTPGHLIVDSKRQRLTLVEGGGFGHWGIEIAAPGSNAPEMEGYTLQVADGVWVWHEIQ